MDFAPRCFGLGRKVNFYQITPLGVTESQTYETYLALQLTCLIAYAVIQEGQGHRLI